MVLDFTNIDLNQGSAFVVDASLSHDSFSGGNLSDENNNIAIDFTFLLPASYADAFTMGNSQEFIDAIQLLEANFADACNGASMTDQFNCDALQTLDATYNKTSSGVDGLAEGF